jgi:hypothetical protein
MSIGSVIKQNIKVTLLFGEPTSAVSAIEVGLFNAFFNASAAMPF